MLSNERKTNLNSPPPGEPFLLEYLVEGQEVLGVNLRKICSRLVIRSESRQAFLEKHRSQSDRAGEPIGTFQADLSDQILASLLGNATTTIFAELPSARGEGPGSSVITLKFEQGARKITRTFSTGDMTILSVVENLLIALDQLSGQLERHPLCALQTAIEYKDRPQPHFVLIFTNIGRDRITFADPRFLPTGEMDCWAGAQVAELPEEKPGMTSPPLQWIRLAVERPASAASSADVVLNPGNSFSAKTITWQNSRTKARYLALGVFSDYTGPAISNGIYRIRGATFSAGLEFTPR